MFQPWRISHASLLNTLTILAMICLSNVGSFASAQDIRQPQLLLPLGHTDEVVSVAVSRNMKNVVTGSFDRTAIVWDVETGRSIATLKGHIADVSSVALSDDSTRAITLSSNVMEPLRYTAILWDVARAQPIQTFRHKAVDVKSVTIDDVTSVALSGNGKRVLTGSYDKTAILWDAETAKPLRILNGHTQFLTCVALSSDGTRALTGSYDKTAILWDTASAIPLVTFRGHNSPIHAVALSADGGRVLTLDRDETVILWDLATVRPIQTFKGAIDRALRIALSADGSRVLIGELGDFASLWEAATGKQVRTFRSSRNSKTRKIIRSYGTSVALTEDGKKVLTSSGSDTMLVDVDAYRLLRSFNSHHQPIYSLAVRVDANRLLFSRGASAVLWDFEAFRPTMTLEGHDSFLFSVAMSGDGKRAITAPMSGPATFWDVATGMKLHTLMLDEQKPAPLDSVPPGLSADGTRALTASGNGPAILWDTAPGRPLRTFRESDSNKTNSEGAAKSSKPMRLPPVYRTSNHKRTVLSGDGKRVLTLNLGGNSATLWDAETATALLTFTGQAGADFASAALSTDGRFALTGFDEGTATLWDTQLRRPLQTFKEKGGVVSSVALSDDGKLVLTGTALHAPTLWNAETGKRLQSLEAHTGIVQDFSFGGRHSLIFTSADDGTIRVWVPGRTEPLFGILPVDDEWLAWTPEGYYTCSPNGEGLIAWKIDGDTPGSYRIVGPDQFRKTFYRPDLFPHLFRERDLTRALALADKERNRTAEPPTSIARGLPPNVAVLKPERDGDMEEDMFTVEAHAFNNGEYPVTRMRLLIDGRPYQKNRSSFDVPDPKPGRVKRSWQIELEPGEHTIQVVAESAVSEGRSDVVRIRRKAAIETLPRLFVLAIGISDYEKEDLRKDVYYAAADARKFSDTVERSSKPLYREIKVTRLIDRDATRRKVLRALTDLRTQATQSDTVIIYFAGHGELDDRGIFYFLPADVDREDLVGTGLSQPEFRATVEVLPGRVILLLDACHSGKLIESGVHGRSGPGDGPMDVLYRDMRSNEVGLVVMCASKGLEKAMERSGGLFTTALVEGLQGKAPRSLTGVVYLKALDGYVTERVKELSEGKQHPLSSVAATITNIPLTKP